MTHCTLLLPKLATQLGLLLQGDGEGTDLGLLLGGMFMEGLDLREVQVRACVCVYGSVQCARVG